MEVDCEGCKWVHDETCRICRAERLEKRQRAVEIETKMKELGEKD